MSKPTQIVIDAEHLDEIRNGLIVLIRKHFTNKETEFTEEETTAMWFVLDLIQKLR